MPYPFRLVCADRTLEDIRPCVYRPTFRSSPEVARCAHRADAERLHSEQLALLLQVLPKVGESPTAAPPLPTITIADTTTRLRCQLTRPAALRRAHIESPDRPHPGMDHARGRPCWRTPRTASNERPGPPSTTDRFQPHFARLAGRLAPPRPARSRRRHARALASRRPRLAHSLLALEW